MIAPCITASKFVPAAALISLAAGVDPACCISKKARLPCPKLLSVIIVLATFSEEMRERSGSHKQLSRALAETLDNLQGYKSGLHGPDKPYHHH